MKKYFGYTRVSTQKQGEGVSLTAQREAISQYANKNGFEISCWFEEVETAATVGRPLFTKLVRELHNGKATGVVIHKIDRSARNFRDWAHIGELADKGVEIHFVTESLDFQSRGGRLAADIQAVIAADYIRNLREESIKGLYGRLKQGIYPFQAPIGYLDTGGGKPKTVDPLCAPLIAEGFNLYASGQYSITTLGQQLDILGLRNNNQRPLNKTSLSRMLRNPFYHGIIRIKRSGEEFPGIHQPIITKVLFDRVQHVLSKLRVKKSTRHEYAYRGLFRCGLCDTAMVPERQKVHIYYRCHTKTCSTKCIHEEIVDQTIAEVLAPVAIESEKYEEITTQLQNWFRERPHRPTLADTITLQLRNIEHRLTRTTDILIDGHIDQHEHRTRIDALEIEKNKLEDALKKMQHKPPSKEQFQSFCQRAQIPFTLLTEMSLLEKRELIDLISTKRIVINKNVYVTSTVAELSVNRYTNLLKRTYHRMEQDY